MESGGIYILGFEMHLQFVHEGRDGHTADFGCKDALLHGENGGGEGFDTQRGEFAARLQTFPCAGYFDNEAGGIEAGVEVLAEAVQACGH